MSKKRDAYVHTRVTQREMLMIDALARHLRRTRSDTLRFLALEKAEELGVVPAPRPPQPKPTEKNKGGDEPWKATRLMG
ncbi:MAG: hypothetical protein WAS33_06470 [Candidatus Promineifilaceae bacterium]